MSQTTCGRPDILVTGGVDAVGKRRRKNFDVFLRAVLNHLKLEDYYQNQ